MKVSILEAFCYHYTMNPSHIERQHTIRFEQNFNDSVQVILSAARWRTENDIKYSQFWDPDKISADGLLEEFYAEDAFVLYVNDVPTATAILTNEKKSKIPFWGKGLGKEFNSTDCLYLDQVSVVGDKIGQGYVRMLISEIETYAKTQGYTSLRLDVDSDLDKLVSSYTACGFSEVTRKDVGYRTSIFMEKKL